MSKKRSEYFIKVKEIALREGILTEIFFNFYEEMFLYHERYQNIYNKSISLNHFLTWNETPALNTDLIKFSSKDMEYLHTAIEDLLDIIQRHTGTRHAGQREKIFSEKDFFDHSLRSLLKRDCDSLREISSGLVMEPDKLIFILVNLYRPLVKNMREGARDNLAYREREKHLCPFCGFYPDMSAIMESGSGGMIIHCALCEHEWEFGRLRCAVCGNSNHEKLGFLISRHTGMRVDFCDQCGGYIKTLLVPPSSGIGMYDLTIENLLTRDLDCSAMESGYSRP